MDRPPLKVLVADDHALFRQGLISLLRLHPTFELIGEVGKVGDLAPMIEQHGCDVLLLDLGMDRDPYATITDLAPKVGAIVVVTANEQAPDAFEAIRAGARAVVYKRFAIETLMDAIGAAVAGDVWMPPNVQRHAMAAIEQPQRDGLTQREREIVRNVALGMRNAEVARKLFISELTVKTHLANIFSKLGVRDRVELTLYAARAGIIGVHERP